MKNRVQWIMVALAVGGLAGAGVMAQTSTDGPSTPSATGTHSWHRGRPGMMGLGLMHALRQLNLSSAQRQQIHTIMSNARAQFAAQRASSTRPDFTALANPADPNHAAALAQLESNMNTRLERQDGIEKQIYAVLTPEQQSQLPTVLANIKAKMAQRASGT